MLAIWFSLAVEGFKEHAVLVELFCDGFPEEQQFAATERADVVGTLKEDRILELVTDGSCVILDARSKFVSCQISDIESSNLQIPKKSTKYLQ